MIWRHLAWIHPPALSPIVCGTLDQLLNLSELQFSPLKNGDNCTSSQDGWEDKVLYHPQCVNINIIPPTTALVIALSVVRPDPPLWPQLVAVCVFCHVITEHNFSSGA